MTSASRGLVWRVSTRPQSRSAPRLILVQGIAQCATRRLRSQRAAQDCTEHDGHTRTLHDRLRTQLDKPPAPRSRSTSIELPSETRLDHRTPTANGAPLRLGNLTRY